MSSAQQRMSSASYKAGGHSLASRIHTTRQVLRRLSRRFIYSVPFFLQNLVAPVLYSCASFRIFCARTCDSFVLYKYHHGEIQET